MGECGCHLDVHRCRDHADDVVIVLSRAEADELARLRAWVADRDEHAARSALDAREERGWRLALGGVEHRLRKIFGARSV